MEISENEDFEDSFFSYGYEWNDEKRLAEIASIADCKISELVIMED